MRGGMYWSGDLAYRDADGFVYFAGRTADWLRVDGENLAAAPDRADPAAAPRRSPRPRCTPCPTTSVGDQVMAALGAAAARCRPASSRRSSPTSPTCRAKGWPRYVRRAVDTLPRTATNKVLKRELAAEGPVAGQGGGPDPVGQPDDVEAAGGVGVPDRRVVHVPRGLRHRCGAARPWLVEVADLARVLEVADVEEPEPGGDHRARHDPWVVRVWAPSSSGPCSRRAGCWRRGRRRARRSRNSGWCTSSRRPETTKRLRGSSTLMIRAAPTGRPCGSW